MLHFFPISIKYYFGGKLKGKSFAKSLPDFSDFKDHNNFLVISVIFVAICHSCYFLGLLLLLQFFEIYSQSVQNFLEYEEHRGKGYK